MTRRLKLSTLPSCLLALGLALSAVACEPGEAELEPEEKVEAQFQELRSEVKRAKPKGLSKAEASENREKSIDLGLALLRAKSQESKDNLSVSPYSLRHAFGMSLGMARGDTQKEIVDTLKLLAKEEQNHQIFNSQAGKLNSYGRPKTKKQRAITVQSANRFFIDESIKPKDKYLDILQKFYNTGLYRIDFSQDPDKARADINAWVSLKTRELIPKLLGKESIRPDTLWVIVNALYLKIDWAETFKPKSAKKDSFWLADGKKVKRKLMSKYEMPARYGSGEDFRWADVDLAHKALGFLLIVPDKGKWAKVFESISGKSIQAALDQGKKGDVTLTLPKFKLESHLDLKPVLKSLGMKIPFSNRADFSGLHGKKDVRIGSVIQKCVVDLNEEGIEAAAATAIESQKDGSAGDPDERPFQVRADRPFLFMIHDRNTGAILFSARVSDPK